MSTPCEMELHCRNSEANSSEVLTKCALCRLSPDNIGKKMAQYWAPTKLARDLNLTKHPDLEGEKRFAKFKTRLAKLTKKRSRDPNKRKVSRLAAQAEKTTEKNIIRATKNSGRRNKDGDHISLGMITLDTKLQTTRENPVILLSELEKVRDDAMRSGKLIGGLVIRNKHNVGVVVLSEEDYTILTKGLKIDESAY